MAIWQQVFWRWLGWVILGAMYGCLLGVLIGGFHGMVYAIVFVTGVIRLENASLGLGFGAFYGVWEGTFCGAIAFCIASLLRMKSPSSLSHGHFKKTISAAFFLCLLGSIAGALTLMTGAFLWTKPGGISVNNVVGQSYYWGCQIGFNLGLFCGVLAPDAVEKAREACKLLFASARRT